MDRYSYLQQLDKRHIWHPYTQMKDYENRDLLLIDRAAGIILTDLRGREYFDTISSWWCILHGHNHPTISEAVSRQLGKLDQVLLAGTSHEPAILLADQLTRLTPSDLSRVF
ncbi:MAG: aminotransferase class III-fold pyridoxal phosphate-dependent enzyme, partial [Deltaproteobacteria bacterium]